MTDGYPESNPRPKIEITLDDLTPAAAPSPNASPWPPVAEAPQPVAPAPQPQPKPSAEAHYSTVAQPPTAAVPDHGLAIAAMSLNRKSVGAAVLLSLLFTGAGQIYCGRAGRGIAFFCAAVFSAFCILFVIGLVLLPIVWLWSAIDAGNLASKQNAMLLAALANQPAHAYR